MLEAVSMFGFFNCNTSTNAINCQCLHDRYNMHNRDYVHRVALLPDVKYEVWMQSCLWHCSWRRKKGAVKFSSMFRLAIQQIVKYHDQF